jgi:ATP-binding cassette subfamily B multidrug efflux pump
MEETPSKKTRGSLRSLLVVLSFLRSYPGWFCLAIGLLLTNIGIELALPQVLGESMNGLQRYVDHQEEFSPTLFVIIYLALVGIRSGIGIILGPIRNRLVHTTLGDIRAAIYSALQRMTFSYHDRTNSGELISRATTDVWRLQEFFFACMLMTADIVVTLIATTWLIFSISPALGAAALATMGPTVALIAYYASRLQPRWREVHDLHSAMTTVVQENIAGVRVVKAFAREQSEISKFRDRKETYLKHLLHTVNYWASRVPFAQFIYGLSMPLVLWIGGRQVIQGELLIGDLAKVVFYLMAIGHRMGLVGQFTNIVQNASASAERICEILKEPPRIVSGQQPLPSGGGEVRFEGVSFAYEKDRPSLHELSLAAPAGKTIAIVGPTGSGKSTLVQLIPRFYDPEAGRILLDGVDVRDLDLAELRRSVSMIFQETFLFSATVAENIAYGRPNATVEEIERSARLAQAHEFITGLEKGYDTIIGERGVSLSGGQRQRIAIARAFLMNPRVLILDDATASVDSQTERLIQEAMRELSRGRTTFIIAQRFSTVQHADQIVVLNQGRLVEIGTHQELTARGGFYAEIVSRQLRGRERQPATQEASR